MAWLRSDDELPRHMQEGLHWLRLDGTRWVSTIQQRIEQAFQNGPVSAAKHSPGSVGLCYNVCGPSTRWLVSGQLCNFCPLFTPLFAELPMDFHDVPIFLSKAGKLSEHPPKLCASITLRG